VVARVLNLILGDLGVSAVNSQFFPN
jgi:hypothetical protein